MKCSSSSVEWCDIQYGPCVPCYVRGCVNKRILSSSTFLLTSFLNSISTWGITFQRRDGFLGDSLGASATRIMQSLCKLVITYTISHPWTNANRHRLLLVTLTGGREGSQLRRKVGRGCRAVCPQDVWQRVSAPYPAGVVELMVVLVGRSVTFPLCSDDSDFLSFAGCYTRLLPNTATATGRVIC